MRYWDWMSFVLYILIAFAIVFFTYFAENKGRKCINKECKRYNAFGSICYVLLFIVLTFFSVFRDVGVRSYGGADAGTYIEFFQNSNSVYFNLLDFVSLRQTEPLFFLFAYVIRRITDNYIIFFLFYYVIIYYAYIKFISKQFDRKMNIMPLFYMILVYLNSFNTMRTAMAMAMVLLAYNALTDRKEKKVILLLIVAAGFHYTSLIVLIFYIFYKIVSSKLLNKRKWAILFVFICYIFFFFCSSIISNIISSTKYKIYLDQQNTFIGQLVIIIVGLLSIINFNELKRRMKECSFILWAVIFNFMMIPLTMYFGFFRLNIYFIFPRLLLWTYIIDIYKDKLSSRKGMSFIIDIFTFYVVIGWTVFRISKDWYPEAIMPYFNILFK